MSQYLTPVDQTNMMRRVERRKPQLKMLHYFTQTFKTLNYITMSIGSVYFYDNMLYTRKHLITIINTINIITTHLAYKYYEVKKNNSQTKTNNILKINGFLCFKMYLVLSFFFFLKKKNLNNTGENTYYLFS